MLILQELVQLCMCMWYYIEMLQLDHINSVKKLSLFSIDESKWDSIATDFFYISTESWKTLPDIAC